MDFFCEIFIKRHYRFFEKTMPDLIYIINNMNLFNECDIIFYTVIRGFNVENKYKELHKLLNNIFIPEPKKNELLYKFYVAEKHFNSLKRFAYLMKIKKAKECSFETDLCMNPLEEVNENNKIKIYEKQTNMFYTFKFSDLNNIIENCLSYAPNFFSQPLPIKNPLTNVEFSRNNLYNIYFKMRFQAFPINELFHLFFLSNFDIKKFKIVNMCIIREVAIKKYVASLSDDIKNELIRDLLLDYDGLQDNIDIDPEFPSDVLLKHFSHLIYHYHIQNYSLNPLMRNTSANTISQFLKNFKKLNPCFGRKMIITKNPIFIPNNNWKYDEEKNSYYTFVCNVITEDHNLNLQKVNKKKPIKSKHYNNRKNKNKKRAKH